MGLSEWFESRKNKKDSLIKESFNNSFRSIFYSMTLNLKSNKMTLTN
jgi:hypothetical protein